MAKKTENIKGIKGDELKKKLADLQENIRVIKFKGQVSKSKNVKEAKNLKKQVAQVLTEMNKNNINKK